MSGVVTIRPFGWNTGGRGIIGSMSSHDALCVCGQPAGPHDCTGDPDGPARQVITEEAVRLHACAECGTEDKTVAGGGTALCFWCAELSACQARHEGRAGPGRQRWWSAFG